MDLHVLMESVSGAQTQVCPDSTFTSKTPNGIPHIFKSKVTNEFKDPPPRMEVQVTGQRPCTVMAKPP